jgi:hypothetical protein
VELLNRRRDPRRIQRRGYRTDVAAVTPKKFEATIAGLKPDDWSRVDAALAQNQLLKLSSVPYLTALLDVAYVRRALASRRFKVAPNPIKVLFKAVAFGSRLQQTAASAGAPPAAAEYAGRAAMELRLARAIERQKPGRKIERHLAKHTQALLSVFA